LMLSPPTHFTISISQKSSCLLPSCSRPAASPRRCSSWKNQKCTWYSVLPYLVGQGSIFSLCMRIKYVTIVLYVYELYTVTYSNTLPQSQLVKDWDCTYNVHTKVKGEA
jgi:hypothetical protein